MRFREMKQILDENYDTLVFNVSAGSSGYKVVENYFGLITSIHNIEPLGFIDKEIEELKRIKSPFNVTSATENMNMPSETYSVFKKNVQTIIDKCNAVRIAIDTCLPKQSELSITVGLPEFKLYEDLVDFNERLQKIFTIYLEEDADKIEIQNFDSGSLWTEIVFPSLGVMAGFGSLISLTSYLFTTIRKHRIAEKQLDELDFDQDVIKKLKKALLDKALTELDQDVEVFLTTDDEEKPSKEKISSTSKAAMLLFDLLDNGTTFEAAITSNEEIQKTYPTLDSFKLLPTTAKHKLSGDIPKLITKKNETESTDD